MVVTHTYTHTHTHTLTGFELDMSVEEKSVDTVVQFVMKSFEEADLLQSYGMYVMLCECVCMCVCVCAAF